MCFPAILRLEPNGIISDWLFLNVCVDLSLFLIYLSQSIFSQSDVQRLNVPRNIRSPTGDELLSFAENFKNLLDRPAWCGGLLSVISQDVLDRSIQVTLSDENPQCLVTATALTSIILCIGVGEQNGSNLMVRMASPES